MTKRLFPKDDQITIIDSGTTTGGMPTIQTLSDVLTLSGAGTEILNVTVSDEKTIYLYDANGTTGDFQDTTHGGYWNKIVDADGDMTEVAEDQLTFDVTNQTTVELSNMPDNVIVKTVTLNIYEAFESGVQIEIGDNTAPARFMLSRQNRPNKIGEYVANPNVAYKNVTPLVYKLKITFLNVVSSVGKCAVSIEYYRLKPTI